MRKAIMRPCFLATDKHFDSRISCFKKIQMKKILDDDLAYEILSAVEEVPEGKVATYGQIARLIGREKNSRLVGKVLSRTEYYGDYPCHRIVNHCGRLVPGWDNQKYLLAQEGITLKDDTHIDLKHHQWDY